MYLHCKVWSHLLLVFLLGVLVASAGQLPQETVSPTESLKERVLLFYRTVQKGDKVSALGFIAPDSKNDFFRMHYEGLVSFHILDAHLSDVGDSATVKILRTDNFPGFPQLLDHTTSETWKRIEGQWYLVLPSFTGEVNTPFGKMRLGGGQGKDSQAAPPPELLPEHQKNIDPNQARKAVEMVIQEENKKSAEPKKAEEKKKSDTTNPDQPAAPKSQPQR